MKYTGYPTGLKLAALKTNINPEGQSLKNVVDVLI
jgi:hypothetical protein